MDQLQQNLNINARFKIKSRNNPEIIPAQADLISVFDLTGNNLMQIAKIKLRETVLPKCPRSWKALSPRASQLG